MERKKNQSKGFTLIEIIIVIVLIGIIMMISMGAFMSSRKSARDGKRKADLEQLRSALEMYRSDLGFYPEMTEVILGRSLVNQNDANIVYLTTIPQDPNNSSGYTYYYSRDPAKPNSYLICAHLEIAPPASALDCPGDCLLDGCGASDGLAPSCNYEICNP